MILENTLGQKLTYGGATAAVYGYFTVTEWCAVVGAGVAVLGGILQLLSWIQKTQRQREEDSRQRDEDKRSREEHAIRMDLHRAELARLTGKDT